MIVRTVVLPRRNRVDTRHLDLWQKKWMDLVLMTAKKNSWTYCPTSFAPTCIEIQISLVNLCNVQGQNWQNILLKTCLFVQVSSTHNQTFRYWIFQVFNTIEKVFNTVFNTFFRNDNIDIERYAITLHIQYLLGLVFILSIHYSRTLLEEININTFPILKYDTFF